jgi:protein-tyrosine kinase
MSRIDQALRRAAGDASAPQIGPRSDGPGAVGGSLEAFTAETVPRHSSVGRPAVDTSVKPALFMPQPAEPRRPVPAEPKREVPREAMLKPSSQRFAGFSPELAGKRFGTAIDSKAAAQYEALASALVREAVARTVRTVLVTSAVAGEGKTITAINVALALTRLRQRVLLVDGDLSCPGLHQLLQLQNVGGLSEALVAGREAEVVGAGDGLSVVTAGAELDDPMSALVSNPMRRLLAEAARQYDFVLLDAPPVSTLVDAHLLAWLADATVLVIGADATPAKAVQEAVESLGVERVLGAVLNRADARYC